VQLFLIDLHSINVPFFIAIKEKPAFVIFPGNYFLHYLYPFFIPEIEKISDHDWRLLIKKGKREIVCRTADCTQVDRR